MKLFITLLCMVLGGLVFCQSSVSVDSSLTLTGEVSLAYEINTDLTTLEELTIEQFFIDSLDTVLVYQGTYNFDEDDASDFMKTHFDFSNHQIKFWVGDFSSSFFYVKIVFVRLNGTTEIIEM